MAKYKGFSTARWLTTKSFSETDIDVVKTDITNHIFTRLGERIVQPGFGTRIPDLTFEQNDEETVKIIREDLMMVFKHDPRVEVQNLVVLPLTDNNAILVIARLKYIELDVVDELRLDIKGQGAV